MEGSAGKGFREKTIIFSGIGLGDAQKIDVLVQLTVRPSSVRMVAICGKQLMRLSAVVPKLMSSI
jgi:hypothetical protein